MRKLEREMNQAIRGQRNWAGSNTTVFTTDAWFIVNCISTWQSYRNIFH